MLISHFYFLDCKTFLQISRLNWPNRKSSTSKDIILIYSFIKFVVDFFSSSYYCSVVFTFGVEMYILCPSRNIDCYINFL